MQVSFYNFGKMMEHGEKNFFPVKEKCLPFNHIAAASGSGGAAATVASSRQILENWTSTPAANFGYLYLEKNQSHFWLVVLHILLI